MTPACIIVLNQEPKPARDQRTIDHQAELFLANVFVPQILCNWVFTPLEEFILVNRHNLLHWDL